MAAIRDSCVNIKVRGNKGFSKTKGSVGTGTDTRYDNKYRYRIAKNSVSKKLVSFHIV